MKIAFAIGCPLTGLAARLYKWMQEAEVAPQFILCTGRNPEPTVSSLGIPVAYAPGINSHQARLALANSESDAVVVFGCGIVGRETCDAFPDTLINAHAGKLPEFRGINNVEWAYLERKPLINTVHFIVPNVDSGKVILEREMKKLCQANDIEEIRNHAFEQCFQLVPEALKFLRDGGNASKQPEVSPRPNRYAMHPFLKKELTRRLNAGEV